MRMRLRLATFLVALLFSAAAAEPAQWPNGPTFEQLSEIGSGVAVIFSPDLAKPGNRRFYERLGFTYFDDPSWHRVLEELRARNTDPTREPIGYVILETHGANGNGLKLQTGKYPGEPRSYISAGALQEALDAIEVRRCYVSACNAGRLLRPEIYRSLDRSVDDPLFLPATLGIVDASPQFDPSHTRVELLRRTQSNLETLVHGDTAELNAAARRLIEDESGRPLHFVVSTMLIQLVLKDPALELTSTGYVERKSLEDIPENQSENLFQRFLRLLNQVSARESEAGMMRAQHEAARASGSE